MVCKVKENKERRMKEKQDRLREQQRKKDAELEARQLIQKVSHCLHS